MSLGVGICFRLFEQNHACQWRALLNLQIRKYRAMYHTLFVGEYHHTYQSNNAAK
jgi:hypothetical protein